MKGASTIGSNGNNIPSWNCQSSIASIADKAWDEVLILCEVLESIADSLPAHANQKLCLDVGKIIESFISGVHHFEEITLFPAYDLALMRGGETRYSLERLRREHLEDESCASDLAEALLVLGHSGAVENPDMVGFMLRCFFVAKRRHVAFGREYILPALRLRG
ncbi:hemerythrin domain-containing protein [Bosea thiooxidans]|nr:hemerythrin domain-containing protein [Bosea sp. (in: a-proteobacteria)]